MKNLISIVFLLSTHYISCQALTWDTFVDSIPTLSSPTPSDLNHDGNDDGNCYDNGDDDDYDE